MKIAIRRPDDLHLHVRQGAMLRAVLPATARRFGRALIMPNTDPPVLTASDAAEYRRAIEAEAGGLEPLMAVKLVASTTPETIRACKGAVVAGKLYPEGVTTNSADGVSDFARMYPAFEAMEQAGMVLCLHGETPGVFSLDREKTFLETLRGIALAFPRLRIVLEHVTTADAVREVERLPDTVAATITAHHLFLTLDDVIGGSLRPHAFCKPVAKRPEDREALIAAATGGNPKFFLGTDSAPHLRGRKECDGGCAGVFSAPVAMEAYAAIFERRDALGRLEDFASAFGARFYGLSLNEGTLTLAREPWKVPPELHGVVPFLAGETIDWRVV
ncbi:MAG TPA: dihydroorotase [Candidatus Binatia bacterium]|nr:dihydroorotase [Candidatus Binatia bacterium]